MGDFSKKQGGKQSVDSTQANPQTSGTPKTGFIESPKGEKADFGPGPGNPANTRKIK